MFGSLSFTFVFRAALEATKKKKWSHGSTSKTYARTSMFIAALLKTARTQKQPRCPLTEEWVKKMWYIHTMEYYSVIKRNEIMPFAATWMDLEIIILSKSDRDRQILYDITYR